MKLCPRCQQERPSADFPVRAAGYPDSFCRPCAKAYFHAYYLKNKEKYVQRALAHQRRHREKVREILRPAKDRPCADCGNTYPYYVMDFDHREGEEKLCNVSALHGNRRVSIQKLLAEIAKCDVVCANCHRERTFRRRQNWPRKYRNRVSKEQENGSDLLL